MFRKPKRKVKDSLRKATNNEDEDDEKEAETGTDESMTRDLLSEARKRIKGMNDDKTDKKETDGVMHTYAAKSEGATTVLRDLVTSTAQHHPQGIIAEDEATTSQQQQHQPRDDGIYRGDQVRNKFHAGPIRAAAHVRVTARFDYQPDICKDYKETGFCGYGDTCIYLHDRGDTISGWQLEQQWEEQQKQKKMEQEQEIMNNFATTGEKTTSSAAATAYAASTEDGIPFACYICRGAFRDPIVTHCQHYFCEVCIMNHVRTTQSDLCPVCNKDTNSVFNIPTKLIAKKRKVLGIQRSKEVDSWQQYLKSFQCEAGKQEGS